MELLTTLYDSIQVSRRPIETEKENQDGPSRKVLPYMPMKIYHKACAPKFTPQPTTTEKTFPEMGRNLSWSEIIKVKEESIIQEFLSMS